MPKPPETILTYNGLEAMKLVKGIFFPGDQEAALVWAAQWTQKEQKESKLEVYSRKKRTKEYLGITFTISGKDGKSVLGEQWPIN